MELQRIIDVKYYKDYELDTSLFNISCNIDKNICYKEFDIYGNKIIILLDKDYNIMVDKIYFYRLIARNIQIIRKIAGLHPWDPIMVYWKGNPKYDIDTFAIDYITKIICVSFLPYIDDLDIYFQQTNDELEITFFIINI